jgi:ATPase subunit of ABC transporter with duplicated ATPase domains
VRRITLITPHPVQHVRDSQESTMHPVIEISGVRKTYGKTVAGAEASFEVNQGEIFGLIGPFLLLT